MEKRTTARPVRSAKEQMLRGSAWMTAGSILSRVLGAIYIVPWRIWLGGAFLAANVLFTKGYQVYSIFIIISTAGIPGAISKQVAHYNAMNEYRTGFRLFFHGLLAMVGMGVVACGLMWYFAPALALHDPALTRVFRSLAWPLLLIPAMSIMRGFFQGYNEMAPSALSQFIEQLARIVYMLLMTYTIMRLAAPGGHGDYVEAVSQSTFAAFVGAVFGLALLVWYFFSQRQHYRELVAQSANQLDISIGQILLDMMRQAVPFIIMDSAINVYYIIDQYTFEPLMRLRYAASPQRLGEIYGIFAGNANKQIMIIVSIAVAMAVAALPILAEAKTKNDLAEVAAQTTNVMQLFFIVMLPAAFGMWAIAEPMYVVFFGYDALGVSLMEESCALAIGLGLYTVLASVMQGLFHNRLAMLEMAAGLGVKIVLQWPFIFFFNVYGPTLATLVGTLVSSALMLWSLWTRYPIRARQTLHRLVGILTFSVIMAVVVRLVQWLLAFVVDPQRGFGALVMLIVALPIGIAVYGYAVLKTRLADMILGARVGGLRRRLHMQ